MESLQVLFWKQKNNIWTLEKEERHFVSQGKAANGNTTDAKDVGADDPKYAQCN